MNTNQPRRPAGTPTGGQWAPTAHDEPDITLEPPVSDDLAALPTKALYAALPAAGYRRAEAIRAELARRALGNRTGRPEPN